MDMDKIISDYLAEKADAAAAAKRADALKKIILAYAGGADSFKTDGHIVIIKRSEQTRIDTARVMADFPEFKEVYGKTTVSVSIDARELSAVVTKTA